MIAELFLERQDTLGEGILVQTDLNRIAWVDILGKKLMISDLAGEAVQVFDQTVEIGAVLPANDNALILVLRNTVVWFDPETSETNLLWSAGAREPATNRSNDAAIDPFGNFWICSMDFDASAPTGTIYRLCPNGTVDAIDTGFACLNGPAFSNDGTTVYIADTMAGRVFAYAVDPVTQAVNNRRVFLQLGPFEGFPDGMTVDADDHLWVCRLTSGLVSCYTSNGEKLKSVALPVPNVTSCCFGGPDQSTLFVTTARILLDQHDLAALPLSGSVFRIKTDTSGTSPTRFYCTPKTTWHE